MKGIAASPGISVAKAFIIEEEEIRLSDHKIDNAEVENEIAKLDKCIEKSLKQLEDIYENVRQSIGEKDAQIVSTHMELIKDFEIIDSIKRKVEDEHLNLAYAVSLAMKEFEKVFNELENPYFRERAADIRDVGNRLIKNVLGLNFKDMSGIKEKVILVGRDILPSVLAMANKDFVVGIVSEEGGVTSHIAIMAKNMEIPAVLGVKGITAKLKEEQLIAVDGSNGIVEIQIDKNKIESIEYKKKELQQIKKQLKLLSIEACRTKDGKKVEVAANIGSGKDAPKALESGADGVGLFRTEFLFMDRLAMPDEEEQFNAYRQAAAIMGQRPVIIRTIDIGGDKEIPYFSLPKEDNPFLGYRAIRICLDREEIFQIQLRAILRASAYGRLKLMYPMISAAEEVINANKILEKVKDQLRKEQINFDEDIEVGIMVEVPSAAINADIIVKHIDFFSIGTNDLTQYTLSVDRNNPKISKLYNTFNPAVLRLIERVISIAHDNNKLVGICGEFAGNPLAALLLLGMGLDEFSMNPSSISKIKQIIRSVDTGYAKKIKADIMRLEDAASIENQLRKELITLKLDYLLNL